MSQKQSNIGGHCLRDCKDKSSHQIAGRTERNGIAISKNDVTSKQRKKEQYSQSTIKQERIGERESDQKIKLHNNNLTRINYGE